MTRVILALALLVTGVFLYMHRDWAVYRRLAKDGLGTDGWVTGKDEKTKRVDYAFNGPKKMNTGSGRAGYGNKEFDELAVGDSVIVYFAPDDPNVSCLGLPAERLRAQHGVMVWAFILLVPTIGWALRAELKRAG